VSPPDILVELGLDLSSVGGPFFTFGATSNPDDNPQSQFAPNGEDDQFRFGGTLFYDITERVTSVTTTRGRSRELDRFTTGGASVEFTNQDRAFDPFYTDSPYYPDVRPRRDIKVSTITSAGTSVQFTGLVEDWSLDYRVNGDASGNAACVDGFILFGGQQLNAHTAIVQTSGERIEAILDRPEVNWPTSLRDIDTGAQVFQADVIEQGRETLEYLQLCEASEPGALFMGKDNTVTFRDRNRAAMPGTVVFTDAGTALPYSEITVTYGTELLYNRASIAALNFDSEVSENQVSINEYGVVSIDIAGLLMQDDEDALAYAQYLVNKYAEPELRFDTMTVELAGLDDADQEQVLALDLTDIIRVEYQPNGIGDRIVKDVEILGIRNAIGLASHRITFNLGSTDTAAFVFGGGTAVAEYPYSILDSSPFGL
jgi:hypothetical protein